MGRVYTLSNAVTARQLDVCPKASKASKAPRLGSKAPRLGSKAPSCRLGSKAPRLGSKAPRLGSWVASKATRAVLKRRSGAWRGAGSRSSSPVIISPAHLSRRWREGGRKGNLEGQVMTNISLSSTSVDLASHCGNCACQHRTSMHKVLSPESLTRWLCQQPRARLGQQF